MMFLSATRILSFVLLTVATYAALASAENSHDTNKEARDELNKIATAAEIFSRAFHLVHQINRPSVVAIHVQEQVLHRWRGNIYQMPIGDGSGFIIHSDDTASYVLTNAHVVCHTDNQQNIVEDRSGRPVPHDRIFIEAHDRRVFEGIFIGADKRSDLAVIKINEANLPTTRWADSDKVLVGDWVVALGYPLNVGYSASSGIISAIARSTASTDSNMDSFIQTDAAINPGNSGGPLLNLRGDVIGVNARIISETRNNIGLGFAIPANLARRVAEDLMSYGVYYRPVVGIQMRELRPGEAEDNNIQNPGSVVVTTVFPGTPAANSGIETNDVILEVNDVPVRDIDHFRTLVASKRIGEKSTFTVWRNNEINKKDIIPVSEIDYSA